MAERMTLCNMSIEAGARVGMVAPDDTTFSALAGRPLAPRGDLFERAVAYWRTLPSDADAAFDRELTLDVSTLAPFVTWGTSPQDALPIDGRVPDPSQAGDPARRERHAKALAYMGLVPGTPLEAIGIDVVFIGSCTNGRIEDLRAAAAVVEGRTVAPGVRALVVPGSGLVREQAEREGPRRHVPESRLRMAPGGVFALRRDERRRARAGTALRLDVQPQLRGAARARRPHSPPRPGDGRRRRDHGAPDRRPQAGAGMTPFSTITSVAAHLPEQNVDTDAIYPARFLLIMDRAGLGRYVFHDRRDTPGAPFVLDTPPFDRARVLVAGSGFGCGSSREQAVWALADFGIGCVIAPSFGEIFAANCLNNAVLPLVLPADLVARLGAEAERGALFRIDLAQGVVSVDGVAVAPIVLPDAQRDALLEGRDETDRLLATSAAAIDAFEARHRLLQPWLFEETPR